MKKVIFTIDKNTAGVKVSPALPENLIHFVKEALGKGISHFIYTKKDGSLREAYGTLNAELIPPVPAPPSGETAKPERTDSNPNTQKYYDLEAKAWRMFTIANLVAVF